ncbi:group II intron reverse transcriptase/maturase [Caldalkalibacillus thermarum]|nr:group II intron reverse transcriptase/maturase [Caldalkalibacillus thermarum]GGK26476.1 group II intron reverse transcriptase/maturase [Caldalkalibacillus thermarum]
MDSLRYWEYYNMTKTFDTLYYEAKQGGKFNRLYDIITSRENILLAYRTIKRNKGSNTPGTDGKNIEDIKQISDEQLVQKVRDILSNYQPKMVRRVFIPKPNGDKRPLGIPCIMDRIIQQAIKQVIEPIAEAHFYEHSYGFRPLRSTHHAIARVKRLINQSKLHYVIDIDIKGFFDNVNHTRLMKQMWNMGIQDRKILRIIMKMLKAPIQGEGVPTKGTPQGGIISPLLSNIVLNDLDQWIAGQWEKFQTRHQYNNQSTKYRELKKTNLKEGYIVRYADDFKILCRDWKTAQKWYHAVRLYLKDRLKLEISPKKSRIVNLRKQKTEFLGFTIWTQRKGDKWVAYSGIRDKKKQQIKQQAKKLIKQIQKSPSVQNVLLYNSFVLGIHNYFKKATHVNLEFSRIAYDLRRYIHNRLKGLSKYEIPVKPPPTYRKFYRNKYRTYKIADVYLYPLADVKHSWQKLFNQDTTPFTQKGRDKIHKELKTYVTREILKLMKSNLPNSTVQYMDNRLSRYSMKMGRCEITGRLLTADEVHCHHLIPKHLGGTDEFDNLRIVDKVIHKIIHMSNMDEIKRLISELKLSKPVLNKINQYRRKAKMELIG